VLYRKDIDTFRPLASIIQDHAIILPVMGNPSSDTSMVVDSPVFGKPSELISLNPVYYVLLPSYPHIPELLLNNLTKVVNQPHMEELSSLVSLEQWDDAKIDDLIGFNHGTVYSSICLYIIDAAAMMEWACTSSPHAIKGAVMQQAGKFLRKILGSTGFSYLITETKYLCVYYSRMQGDSELMAIQTVHALNRGLALPAQAAIIPGQHLVVSATSHESKSRMLSFIDAN